jgi:hypothetical protein
VTQSDGLLGTLAFPNLIARVPYSELSECFQTARADSI